MLGRTHGYASRKPRYEGRVGRVQPDIHSVCAFKHVSTMHAYMFALITHASRCMSASKVMERSSRFCKASPFLGPHRRNKVCNASEQAVTEPQES